MEPATGALAAKVQEQVERTVHLIGMLPAEQGEWRPPLAGAWTAGGVMGHLLDCLAGLCAVLHAAHPEPLGHFAELRQIPVNQPCEPDEARQRIAIFGLHIEQGFALLKDSDLGRKLPTVFVAEGEPVLTLLLGNLEHLINHKHQLFMYLKLMGVNVGTPDLYQFRGQKG